jgi:hypothetical protein
MALLATAKQVSEDALNEELMSGTSMVQWAVSGTI